MTHHSKNPLSLLFVVLVSTIFVVKIHGKVLLSAELIEVLQRKSNFKDPDNRIIVAFKTEADPLESTQLKMPLDALKSEDYRAALGTLVYSEMAAENWNLEQMLLEYVEEAQIVRRLPIGNTFILEGLDMQQAQQISELDRTVLLALSQYTLDVTSKSSKFKETDTFTNIHPFPEEFKSDSSCSQDDLLKIAKPSAKAASNLPWNIQKIKSAEAWSLGFKGKGLVYGVIDTGVSYKHPIMEKNYAGRRPDGSYDHNYAWFDAVRKEPRTSERDRLRDQKLAEMEEEMVEYLQRHGNPGKGSSGKIKGSQHSVNAHCQLLKRGRRNSTVVVDVNDGYDADISSDESDDCDHNKSIKTPSSTADASPLETTATVSKVVDKCGFGLSEPCDAVGHGTHVASTAVGGFGYGVAPEATWMACRSLSTNLGREEDSLACFNFFLAPHDVNGRNPRPELRPHVIGNSYGWESWAEVTGAGIDLAVRRLEAAGTVMVFAAGNSGPGCGTIHSAFSFTVGATTETGTLAPFSSRGPWTISASWANRLVSPHRPLLIKPDISAPGSSIVGAIGTGHLSKMSGTSMAAPHVAGSTTLLLQACPHLIGRPKEVQHVLQHTAVKLFVPVNTFPCGRDTATSTPNNFFGAGELDIAAAIQFCLNSNTTISN